VAAREQLPAGSIELDPHDLALAGAQRDRRRADDDSALGDAEGGHLAVLRVSLMVTVRETVQI